MCFIPVYIYFIPVSHLKHQRYLCLTMFHTYVAYTS